MKVRLLLTSGLAFAVAACGAQGEDSAESNAVSEATSEAAVIATAEASQQFVDELTASDMFEIEAGKLAQEKGASQKVKDFGAMMVKDHTESSAKLKAAATKAGLAVTVAPTLSAAQAENLGLLRNAGSDFDQIYAAQQVAAHETALTSLRQQAAEGAAQPLQEFARSTAMIVEHHLETAKELP